MAIHINRFVEEFAFLSNFYPSTVYVDGKKYDTVEHAYQAMKTKDPAARETIRMAATPGVAKRLGRCVGLRPDWEDVKVETMRGLVRQKFENPFLRPQLMATEGAMLTEGNHWNDTFWGVCKGKGRNMLGQILMEIRDEIALEEAAEEHVYEDKQD
jgi:ribA/ribD-fused uncharacterized protein